MDIETNQKHMDRMTNDKALRLIFTTTLESGVSFLKT